MRRRPPRTRWLAPGRVAATLGLLALALPSCAYTLRSPFRQDFRRLYVATFGNRTYRRDLEFQLTARIVDEILARTNYELVSESEAEAILEGEITNVLESVLAEDRDDRSREERVTTTADVRLRRNPGGEILLQWRVSDPAEFVLDLDESLDTAFEESLADLAERIVQGLEDPAFRIPGGARRSSDGTDEPTAPSTAPGDVAGASDGG